MTVETAINLDSNWNQDKHLLHKVDEQETESTARCKAKSAFRRGSIQNVL